MLIEEGVEYFNPDEAAELIRVANPGITLEESQSAAWDEGRRLLERAINERLDYAFETTLGGRTIPALLEKAMEARIERSEEHTSELQSLAYLVCRLLL